MSNFMSHEILESALDSIQQSPSETGRIEMIVCRPEPGERNVLEEATLDTEQGLVGDNWLSRWNQKKYSEDKYLAMQITLMNSRVIDAITGGDRESWPLAGDQLFVDFNLSEANLPIGSKVQLGTAVVEVTAEPHLACRKFMDRFGKDAVQFANSDTGKSLKLRGVNARVVSSGAISRGGIISKQNSA